MAFRGNMTVNDTNREPIEQAWQRLNAFGFRRLFYLVGIEETRFATIEEVPNWFDEAGPWFMTMILTEMVALKILGRDKGFRVNDAMTNVMGGMMSMLFRIFNRGFGMTLYVYVYQHYRLFDLPWDSNCTWVLAFLTQDFAYYLWHRALHEFGFFWSFHQMHHSSEYYNLSVALRQGVVQELASNTFELWQAFLIPPQVYLVHRYLNILNQYWVHTELVPKLGPIEWFMNTPSHHRVHHGRNAYCLDKNYGGTLIIFDRLLGTFSEEKEDEQIAYGLVHNVNTFDQLYCQLFVFKELLWDKPWKMMPKGTSLKDRLLAYIYPCGWFPGAKLKWFLWWRLADTEEGIPEIENPIVKHDPILPYPVFLYVCAQMIIHFSMYQTFLDYWLYLSRPIFWAVMIYQVISMQSIGYMLDAKRYAFHFELVKCSLAALFSAYGYLYWNPQYIRMLVPMLISVIIWTVYFTLPEKTPTSKKVT